jgi:lytic murein transglycosylase
MVATRFALIVCLVCAVPAAAHAVQCQAPGGFDAWLASFKQEAAAQGISQRTITTALAGVTYDPNVVARDRKQGVFNQSFEEFSGRMVPPRLNRGANMLRQYTGTLTRIEQQFGVPGSVLIAIWGLETDYGSNVGKFATIRSLASLAFDCRRTDMFQAELMDALRIVERGDLTAEMHGAWAGEIGQTQFMPSSYIKYAIDYDGNGRRDLIRSPVDGWRDRQLSAQLRLAAPPWGPGPNFDVLLQEQEPDLSRTVAYFAQRLDQMVQ